MFIPTCPDFVSGATSGFLYRGRVVPFCIRIFAGTSGVRSGQPPRPLND
jgi:hypothetical protein